MNLIPRWHYLAFEESDEAPDLLNELVSSGYVQEFADESGARTAAGGKPLVTSKLALITTMKDGVVKHRMILDCRVSGANDQATKVLFYSAFILALETVGVKLHERCMISD